MLGNAGWFWIFLTLVLILNKRTKTEGIASALSLIFGFLVTNLFLKNLVARTRPYDFSTLIVPMFDVIRVMLIRFRRRKSLFSPDKNHIHHKFLEIGCSPHKALLYILAISWAFSSLNIVLAPYININILFIGDIVIWTALNVCLDKIQNKKNSLKKRKSFKRII